MSVIEHFGLRGGQEEAAAVRGRDVLVTAGAGSGKTRTLVARYVSLLEERHAPRDLLAITFTEKAAREMRNRIRRAVGDLARQEQDPDWRSFWRELEGQMDAARIGTIHSFCAELLRAHPAEAAVDPQFEVVEEGTTAMLRQQAVESALAWASETPAVAGLFAAFSPRALGRLLSFLLERRLDVETVTGDGGEGRGAPEALVTALRDFMDDPGASDLVAELGRMQAGGELAADAGEALAEQLAALLACWEAAEAALAADRPVEAATRLFEMRREHMRLNRGRRDSQAREMLRALRERCDEQVVPWLGGARSGDPPPDPAAEDRIARDGERLSALFRQAVRTYRETLAERRALDFDDLESQALRLLQMESIRRKWQERLAAVLVDEFQDTNARQRDIVEALTGEESGRLLVVGDARQSIYRFRGADVTVFRRMGADIQSRRGAHIELDLTYRAHAGLLDALDRLLPAIMGTDEEDERLYQVPYTSMSARRRDPRPGVTDPFVELVFGIGENAADARPHAARALVARLIALQEAGELEAWDDVALLFRASSGFSAYEDALEDAGVPFVTVAGGGFYDRPEIRDVLNTLRALSDPWDDLALAGLLRSPVIGVSDGGLYRLRGERNGDGWLWAALQGDLAALDEPDRERAERARRTVAALNPLVDRLPVAELLKRVIDRLDYRAVLVSAHPRYWRNVDKLLADAHTSQLVRVRAFLDYLRSVRDVGAREGEAPVEAEGAVRLMTVHKAKGLEFPFVVIADAARQIRAGSDPAYLLPETGLAFRPDRVEATPLVYGLARWLDRQQSDAEENRLLYVAATRAAEKLIVSGHCTGEPGAWRTRGWIAALAEAADLDLESLVESAGTWRELALADGATVGALAAPKQGEVDRAGDRDPDPAWPESTAIPLYRPVEVEAGFAEDLEVADPARDWRATGGRVHPPGVVIGQMVHRALERWLFPGEAGCEALLEAVALDGGLVDPGQRARAMDRAREQLARFRAHRLYAEIESAEARYHEVPYVAPVREEWADAGAVDLLYRAEGRWTVLDFKADALRDPEGLDEAVSEYEPQMTRYARACRELLDAPVDCALVFLDYMGEVRLEPV